MSASKYVFEVKKRPWYAWVLLVGWFAALVFLAQNALASGAEVEPRAAMIFWIGFAVVLIAGGVVWVMRRD